MTKPCQWALPLGAGTDVAVLEVMNPKLTWPIAIVLAVLAPVTLAAGAAEAVVDAVALIRDLHIPEIAGTVNALITVF